MKESLVILQGRRLLSCCKVASWEGVTPFIFIFIRRLPWLPQLLAVTPSCYRSYAPWNNQRDGWTKNLLTRNHLSSFSNCHPPESLRCEKGGNSKQHLRRYVHVSTNDRKERCVRRDLQNRINLFGEEKALWSKRHWYVKTGNWEGSTHISLHAQKGKDERGRKSHQTERGYNTGKQQHESWEGKKTIDSNKKAWERYGGWW